MIPRVAKLTFLFVTEFDFCTCSNVFFELVVTNVYVHWISLKVFWICKNDVKRKTKPEEMWAEFQVENLRWPFLFDIVQLSLLIWKKDRFKVKQIYFLSGYFQYGNRKKVFEQIFFLFFFLKHTFQNLEENICSKIPTHPIINNKHVFHCYFHLKKKFENSGGGASSTSKMWLRQKGKDVWIKNFSNQARLGFSLISIQFLSLQMLHPKL